MICEEGNSPADNHPHNHGHTRETYGPYTSGRSEEEVKVATDRNAGYTALRAATVLAVRRMDEAGVSEPTVLVKCRISTAQARALIEEER